jgi:hypothetical protein
MVPIVRLTSIRVKQSILDDVAQHRLDVPKYSALTYRKGRLVSRTPRPCQPML